MDKGRFRIRDHDLAVSLWRAYSCQVETQTVPGGMLLPQARQSNRMRSVASIEVEQQRTQKMIKARLRREFMNLLSFFSITSTLLFRQARPLAGFTIVGLQV